MSNQRNRHTWTAEDDHIMLETVLRAGGPARFARACDHAARLLRRAGVGQGCAHVTLTGDLVRRRLWGLATKLAVYAPHTEPRTMASGPLTHTERLVVYWAIYNKSREARTAAAEHGPPDAAYIAQLLARPPADLERAWDILGPARGRRGFGL